MCFWTACLFTLALPGITPMAALCMLAEQTMHGSLLFHQDLWAFGTCYLSLAGGEGGRMMLPDPGGTLDRAVACRQHLFHLLDELSLVIKQAASLSAPHCAACLLRLTEALADQHVSLISQSMPPDFVELLAEAVRRGVGLCVSCVCHQVQAINLRLATSGLFDVQAGTASGTHPSCPCSPTICPPCIRPPIYLYSIPL